MHKNSEIYKLSKETILKGMQLALKNYAIAALIKNVSRYDYITDVQEIDFHYSPTVLSPKKFFFPQIEKLLNYQIDQSLSVSMEAKPTILFGIRPCDLNGIKILTEAFADKNGDPHYLSKKEKTIIIGLDCKKVCDKHAFCYQVESEEAKGGFDIMLYETHDGYLARTATESGDILLKRYFSTAPASLQEWKAYRKEKELGFSDKKPFKKLHQFPKIFEENKDHPLWEEEGNRCLSCGSCIMVCPTCYCFDIVDELDLNMKKGVRSRKWDACMLSDFAAVAGGENFRPSATERLKHRINRKFNYLMKKHKQSVCVGCGRCVRACLAEISPKHIAQTIADEHE